VRCSAAIINGGVRAGHGVLVTGAGGGVALLALQLCIARGADVYVTSGSADKIARAVALGARGGVCYRDGARLAFCSVALRAL
jgi:NADPH:quinone reductase-like Zn-dependent oxidoreductase